MNLDEMISQAVSDRAGSDRVVSPQQPPDRPGSDDSGSDYLDADDSGSGYSGVDRHEFDRQDFDLHEFDRSSSDRLSTDPMVQREQAMAAILAQLRPGQQAMATWRGGELAVSAVPGAGKSTGMAAAAALTIAREQLNLRRYLVVVTFTRSAANNLKAKICANLKAMGLPPLGFTVNTLHGLALQIASRHRDRAGLDLDSQSLVSPNQSHRLIRTCVDRWIAENPDRKSVV